MGARVLWSAASTSMGARRVNYRELAAAFAFGSPAGSAWAQARARELARAGEDYEFVIQWGDFCIAVQNIPEGDPEWCIRRPDGTLERAPWLTARAKKLR